MSHDIAICCLRKMRATAANKMADDVVV